MGLQQETHLEDVADRSCLGGHQRREGLDYGLDGIFGDVGPRTRTDYYQSFHVQQAHGLADRCTADTELLGQLPLRGQPVTRFDSAFADQAVELVHYLLGDARFFYDSKHRRCLLAPHGSGGLTNPALTLVARTACVKAALRVRWRVLLTVPRGAATLAAVTETAREGGRAIPWTLAA